MIIDKFIWKEVIMLMQLDIGHSYWEGISQYGKKFVKISAVIGRFRPFNA